MKKFRILGWSYLVLVLLAMLLLALSIDQPEMLAPFQKDIDIIGIAVAIIAAPAFLLCLFAVYMVSYAVPRASELSVGTSQKKLRRQALHEHIAKLGGKEIFVKRVGTVGAYLEHFLVHYFDDEGSWQVRHIIRNQKKERYYWDDPVVKYEREISAEISQSKQELINDLDLEIHQLRQAIATHANTEQ